MTATIHRRVPTAAAIALALMALSLTPVFAQGEPVPLGDGRGPLEAGSYVDSSTGTNIVFTVDDGWVVSGEPLPGVGTELAPDGFPGIVTLTTFDGTMFKSGCASKGRVDKLVKRTKAVEASAAAFIEALSNVKGLAATTVVETELGGHPALQLDVVSTPGRKCEPRATFLWELPIVREFHLGAGVIGRIIAADVGDEVVVVVIETPARTDASPFAFLDRATALMGTIELEPADGVSA